MSEPSRTPARSVWRYPSAGGVVALAAALAGAVFGRSQLADVVMVFLLGIVVVSLRLGYGPSLLAAVLSVLVYDFFFIPPFYSFAVSDLSHVVTFGVMLLVAVVISSLTQRVRTQAEEARERERRTSVLYGLSRDLTRAQGVQAVVAAAAEHIAHVLGSRVGVMLPDGSDNLRPVFESAGIEATIAGERGVAHRVWQTHLPAGRGAPTFSDSQGLYLPLIGSKGAVGVLAILPKDNHPFADPDQLYFLDAFSSQVAVAIERAELAREADHKQALVEAEQLRNALLSSVSHDLRTPLAIITGSASTLLGSERDVSSDERRSLLTNIYDEAGRLNRLIGNLLDMTRLESGQVTVKKEWFPIEELIGVARARTEAVLKDRDVRVIVPSDLMAPVDGILVEQALVNVLENAAKYTEPATPIEIAARREDRRIVIDIADRGPGFAEGEEDLVFLKFYRGRHRAAVGAGLGLAIARAIAVAHGGSLTAENRDGGGAKFSLSLPIEGEPPEPPAVPGPESAAPGKEQVVWKAL
jgi:two-component system sensor histidine kinase KdpD